MRCRARLVRFVAALPAAQVSYAPPRLYGDSQTEVLACDWANQDAGSSAGSRILQAAWCGATYRTASVLAQLRRRSNGVSHNGVRAVPVETDWERRYSRAGPLVRTYYRYGHHECNRKRNLSGAVPRLNTATRSALIAAYAKQLGDTGSPKPWWDARQYSDSESEQLRHSRRLWPSHGEEAAAQSTSI